MVSEEIMSEKPVLSICIPTYNRADYLRKCLEAIVGQDGFDERVEVVISDNCSTDDTGKVAGEFAEKHGNIRYFRNDANYQDRNFALSLQRASGSLRKLTNDTIIYKPGAISYMLEAAERWAEERPQVYFLASGREDQPLKVDTLEEYIDTVGINLTWIRSLGIWEDDCDDLSVLEEYAHTNLAQVPFLLSNFRKRNGAVIYDRLVMDVMEVDKKNLSYGLFHVFHDNLLGFIRPHLESGEISQECYERLRRSILMDFFTVWMYNLRMNPDQYVVSDEDLPQLLKEAYGKEDYYKEFTRRLRSMIIKTKIRGLLVKHV